MANRGLSAGAIAALGGKTVEFYHLLRLDFSTPLYFTNAPHDINYNDGGGLQTYTSSANLIKIPVITESLKIKPQASNIGLSGAAASNIILMLTEDKGADVYITRYLPSLDEGFLIFKGFTDSYSTSEDAQKGTSTVNLSVANHWTNWEATSGTFLSDAEQQRLYPGDLGLEFSKNTDFFLKNWGVSSAFSWLISDYIYSDSYVDYEGPSLWNYNGFNDLFNDALDNSADLPDTIKLPIIYGQGSVVGAPIFRTLAFGNVIWVVYALAEGTCEALVDIKINGVSYTDATLSPHMNAYFHDGDPSQTVDTVLDAASTLWTTAHRLRGICYVAISYDSTADVWSDGEPEPVFEIKGKKLYNPDTTLTEYSQNPALVLYDYLTNARYGKAIDAADLDGIIAGVNYCDTLVTDNTGGTAQQIKLFEFHGILHTKNSVKKNVESILITMRAHLPWVSGKYVLVIERDDDTSDYTFDEDNITGTFKVKEAGLKNLANVMYYSIVDKDAGYQPLDVVAESTAYLALDGRELKKSLKNPFEDNRYRAQNRANTELKKTRQLVEVNLTCGNAESLQIQTGRVVAITREVQGWASKLFRVLAMKMESSGDVNFTLGEYEPTVYDWDIGVEVTPPSNTTIESPFDITSPTNIILTSGTAALYLKADGTVVSRIHVAWTASDSFLVTGYNIYKQSPTDTDPIFVNFLKGGATDETYITDVEDGILYTIKIKAVNAYGHESEALSDTETVVGKTELPSNVTSFTGEISNDRILLSWDAISDTDRSEYEIREGASWATGTVVVILKTLNFLHLHKVSGDHVFFIKAIDTTGNYSQTEASTTVTVNAPSAPTMTIAYDGGVALLSWSESIGSFPIDYYEVSDSSSVIAEIKNTNYQVVVTWLSENFTVVAYDINGLSSSSGGSTSAITPPSVASLTAEVIDNNVLLRWNESLGTLPIKAYEIRRGDLFSSADVLQEINGTFASFFENVSDTYRYWVVGIDTAGNYGTEQSVTAIVNQPPDYVLNVNWSDDFSGVKTSCVICQCTGVLVATVHTTETFQEHFVNNSWTTPQDQITAGYDYYIEPSQATGSYVQEFDFSTLLPSTLIKIVIDKTVIDGTLVITPTIKVKKLIGDAWTDLGDVWSAFSTDFQYIQTTLTFASTGGDDITNINAMNVILDSKLKNDGGSGTIITDSTGLTVDFNVDFIDVISITVSPNTTSNITAIYDFTDIPNPTSFVVYMYDSAGDRTTGDFSWSARGY